MNSSLSRVSFQLRDKEFIINIKLKEHTLNNGLKILLLEDHSLPIVGYYAFYKVGSINEKPGITGISHFIEHMMFNGTRKYGPKQFDFLLESNGGYSNAYTSHDMTVYYQEFPKDILELVIDLESDRMANLLFDSEIVEAEREIIKEERRASIDNYPPGKLEEELFSLAYKRHPYQWPVIGWMKDISSISREELYDYYTTFYSPNNATVIVVGDFYPNEILPLIKKAYELIPPQSLPSNSFFNPEKIKEKRKKIYKKVEIPSFMVAYCCSEANNRDTFVLDVLDVILSGGKSSRLYQKMVDEKTIALRVSTDFPWRLSPSLFMVYVQMRTGHSNEQGEEVIYQELNKIKKEGVSLQELQKAKNILCADFIRNFKRNSSRANIIGNFELLFGQWRNIFHLMDKYQEITSKDVSQMIEKYFNDKNRTVVQLLPEDC